MLWSVHAHIGGGRGLEFSPDGRLLLSWNVSHQFNDYSVKLWTESGKLAGEWAGARNLLVHSVAWLPGDRIALGMTGGLVLLNSSGFEVVRLPLRRHPTARVEVQWSGNRLFAKADHAVYSWREERGRWQEQNDYAPWPPPAIEASAAPQEIPALGAGVAILGGTQHPRTGDWLLVANDGRILTTDGNGAVQRVMNNWSNDALHLFQVGPEGQLVVPGDRTRVQFWAAGGAHMRLLPELAEPLRSTGVHADGFWIFSGARHLELFDWQGHSTAVIQLAEEVSGLAAAPSGWIGVRGVELLLFAADGQTVQSVSLNSNRDISVVRVWPEQRQVLVGIAAPGADQIYQVCLDAFTVLRSRPLAEHSGGVWTIAIAPDAQTFLTGDLSYNVVQWNADGHSRSWFRQVRNGRTHDHAVLAVDTAVNGLVASGSMDGTVKLWNLYHRHRNTTIVKHQNTIAMNSVVHSVRFADAGQRFWVATHDSRLTLKNVDGDTLLTLIAQGEDWIVFDGQGNFDASLRGANLARVIHGGRAQAVDRFALVFNRPERFWGHWPFATQSTIAHLAQVSATRARRTGTGGAIADDAKLPEVRLSARAVEGQAVLSIEGKAVQGLLAGVQIYLNGVPMLGRDGRRLPEPVNSLHIEHSLNLRPGDNWVEAAVRTTDGLLSYRASVLLHSNKPDEPEWYFLGIGVSHYKEASLNLGYAAKDVQDFSTLLAEALELRGQKMHQKLLLNADATVAHISGQAAFLENAREQDIVVLFIAGHGAYGEDLADGYFFMPHEVDPEDLRSTALPWSFFEDLLLASRANRRLVVMDTCASGEMDAEPVLLETARSSAVLQPRNSRALRRVPPLDTSTAGVSGDAGLTRPAMLQRDRFLYADLLRRTGAVVISSSRGSELSFESPELANGLFTAGLLRALRSADSDNLSVDRLLMEVVPFVWGKSDRQQTPVIDRDNPRADIRLPTLKQ